MEIERYIWSISFFLIGWILYIFQLSRNMPEVYESLESFERIGPSSGVQFSSIVVGMLSTPVTESTFKFLITFNIIMKF